VFRTALAVFALSIPLLAEHAKERLQEAAEVVREMTAMGDEAIPRELLQDAKCAIVIPGAKKGGFFIGAQYGRGFAMCREKGAARGWGAPAAVRMEGGTIGAQIGATETDIFMLVMNDEGMEKLLESKFTLDASAGVAAGPVGRTARASTDTHLTAGILTWSRARGAFAGLTLGGGTMRPDLDENQELYGKKLTNQEILMGNVKPPAAASGLITALNRLARPDDGTRAREKTETKK
jgi:lipid-binding SYLF domain-containing protein